MSSRPLASEYWHDLCRDAGLDPTRHAIVLAVSGGADSMAMAHIIHEFWQTAAEGRHDLRAIVVDHGIRPSSGLEAELTSARLNDLGIPNQIKRIEKIAPKQGLQSWARQERYHLLWQEACKDQAVIATGHHQEDQAETVVMRLAKGSHLKGLGGMTTSTKRHNIRLVRPFLEVSRQDLRDYAARRNIPFIEDPSNENQKFERVRWRQSQPDLARFDFSKHNLLKLSQVAQKLDHGMMAQIRSMRSSVFEVTSLGIGWLNRQAFLALPETMQNYILRQMMVALRAGDHPPSQDASLRLMDWIKALPSRRRTLAGLEFTPKSSIDQGQLIWIYPEAERPWPALSLPQGYHVIDGRWQIYLPVSAMLTPLNAEGTAALIKSGHAKGDFAQDLANAPRRAFWRFPMAKIMPKTPKFNGQDRLIALEEGGIIPHVIKSEFIYDDPCGLKMCFTGGCSLKM